MPGWSQEDLALHQAVPEIANRDLAHRLAPDEHLAEVDPGRRLNLGLEIDKIDVIPHFRRIATTPITNRKSEGICRRAGGRVGVIGHDGLVALVRFAHEGNDLPGRGKGADEELDGRARGLRLGADLELHLVSFERLDAAGHGDGNADLVLGLDTRGLGLAIEEPSAAIEELRPDRKRGEKNQSREKQRHATRSARDLSATFNLMHPVHFKSLNFGQLPELGKNNASLRNRPEFYTRSLH